MNYKNMEKEIWKDVKDYEGIYQVSNFGNVRSLDRYLRNTNKSFRLSKGSLISKTDNGKGYKLVGLSINGRKNKYVHRLVAEAFIPNPNNKPQVNHKDGNKPNNHVDNLEWTTISENSRHAYDTGLQKTGKDKSNAIGVINNSTGLKFDTIKECADYYGIKYHLLHDALRRHKKISLEDRKIRLKNIYYQQLTYIDANR